MINFEEFQNVDIRVGTILSAEVPEWSHWVIRLKVDLGEELGEKTAFSGIMKFYKPEDLVGKQFPFVVNLEPKKIGPENEFSEVMMIMATPGEDDNEVAPVLFKLSKKVPNGTKVR
ncbi:MAG: tRNA-binding protein [Candidatus Woesebacteria bacterium]|nr:tRNA-binding protein [Candidatus Woesebacteria bacterium]